MASKNGAHWPAVLKGNTQEPIPLLAEKFCTMYEKIHTAMRQVESDADRRRLFEETVAASANALVAGLDLLR
jgi:hypothetical protein